MRHLSKKHRIALTVLLGSVYSTLACPVGFSDEGSIEQAAVIVTLDGVRRAELESGVDETLARGEIPPGTIFKVFALHKPLFKTFAATTLNSSNLSLPGYQSMFVGKSTGCLSNVCGPVLAETVFEYVQKKLFLEKRAVAIFCSWEPIKNAVEHVKDSLYQDCGPTQNSSKEDLPPWKQSRWDTTTFERAIEYYTQHHPRVLYIALGDADEWAHLKDYINYVSTLRGYDFYLKKLIAQIKKVDQQTGRNTTLIVATDHGRGKTESTWHLHNSTLAGSNESFIAVWNNDPATLEAIEKKIASPASQAAIRPIIEKAMGL